MTSLNGVLYRGGIIVNAIPNCPKVLGNVRIPFYSVTDYDTHLYIAKNLVTIRIGIKWGFALVFDFFYPEWGIFRCRDQTPIETVVFLERIIFMRDWRV
jgi:hypothetical protein